MTRVYWRRRGPLSIKMKPNRALHAIFIDTCDVIVDILLGGVCDVQEGVLKGQKTIYQAHQVLFAFWQTQSETRSLWLCQPYSTAQYAKRSRQCRVQDYKVGDVIGLRSIQSTVQSRKLHLEKDYLW